MQPSDIYKQPHAKMFINDLVSLMTHIEDSYADREGHSWYRFSMPVSCKPGVNLEHFGRFSGGQYVGVYLTLISLMRIIFDFDDLKAEEVAASLLDSVQEKCYYDMDIPMDDFCDLATATYFKNYLTSTKFINNNLDTGETDNEEFGI